MTSSAALFNLSAYAIGNSAAATPSAIALTLIGDLNKTSEHQQWTYREFDHDVRAMAAALTAKGLTKGDHLALRCSDEAGFILSFFGAIAAGIVPVALSPLLTNEELADYVDDANAKAIVRSPTLSMPEDLTCNIIDLDDLLSSLTSIETAPYAATLEDDPAFLIYTSGTSSKPKGIVHAQRVILGRAPMQHGWHNIKRDDRVLHSSDLNWTYALGVGLMDPFVTGASAFFYTGEKKPDVWPKLINKFSITIFATVPSLFRRILKYSDNLACDVADLRHCLSAGEALSEGLKQNWQQTTNKPIFEAMGQSEISTYVSTTPHLESPAGTKGQIQSGRKITILPMEKGTNPVNTGETGIIAVHRSEPGLMLQYWQRPEEMEINFRGDWFLTGDLASLDEAGNLTHYGRTDEVMNASGFRVSPMEVEAVLASHDNVREAAVTEINITEDLAIIAAFIIAKQRDPALIDQLNQLCSDRLAPYKCPKSIQLVEELPHNQSGKLVRRKLSEVYQPL